MTPLAIAGDDGAHASPMLLLQSGVQTFGVPEQFLLPVASNAWAADWILHDSQLQSREVELT